MRSKTASAAANANEGKLQTNEPMCVAVSQTENRRDGQPFFFFAKLAVTGSAPL